MHKFSIYKEKNPNLRWLIIEEGNINIETGIRFIYALLDDEENVLEKKVFIINGNDFSNIGLSGKDTRIAIIELLLQTIGAILVQE
jgi:hypothetical protein